MIRILFAILLFAGFAACGGENTQESKQEKEKLQQENAQQLDKKQMEKSAEPKQKEKAQKEKSIFESHAYTAPYVCPNHCKGSGGKKPGNCPECGMEYIKNPRHQD